MGSFFFMPLSYTALIKHKSETLKYNIRCFSLKIKVIYRGSFRYSITSSLQTEKTISPLTWQLRLTNQPHCNGFPRQWGRLPRCYSLTSSVSSDYCMQLTCACHVCTYSNFTLFAFTTFTVPIINNCLSTSKRAIQQSIMRCTEKSLLLSPKVLCD